MSLATGKNMVLNLDPEKYEAREFTISWSGEWPVEPEDLKKLFGLAFIAMHGPYGEDGTVQTILDICEKYAIRVRTRMAGAWLNKWLASTFPDTGLQIPLTIHFNPNTNGSRIGTVSRKNHIAPGKAVVIKPNASGSQSGRENRKRRERFEAGAGTFFQGSKEIIVQEFIPGRELTRGVVDSGMPVPPSPCRRRKSYRLAPSLTIRRSTTRQHWK